MPTAPEPRFLAVVRGEHRLVVTDDLGRTDGITDRVEPAPSRKASASAGGRRIGLGLIQIF